MGYRIAIATLGLLLSSAACGPPKGIHVRFAQASVVDIEKARESGETVWYDFEPGDEVPLVFGLIGVSEAVTEQPVQWVAKQPFSIVIFPDGNTLFSFDGESLTAPQFAARWSIALGTDDQGGRGGLLLYIGRPQDVPENLR